MIIEKEGNVLNINAGYSPDFVNTIKNCPDGRRWNPKRKVWMIPITIDNIKFIINEFRIEDPSLQEILTKIEKPLNHEQEYSVNWRVTPFNHQKQGLDLILNNYSMALFWEQGLGKSAPTIKMIEYRLQVGDIKTALIVSPKTVLTSWQIEWKKFSNIKPTVIGGTKRLQLLKDATVALINYDLLLPMQKQLAEKHFNLIVFDESQMIKEHTSQRSKIAYELAKSITYRLLLTGTPIGNSAADIFSQFKVLDESIFGTSFFCFRNKYFRDFGHGFPDWKVIPSMLPEIREKMALRSQRLKKDDVLDLPEKLYTIQTVDASPEQARIYKDIERDLYTEIEGQEIAFQYLLTKFIKLSQICSGSLKYEGKTIEIEHEKLTALKQIINDYPGKVVVFTVFLNDIAQIMAAFPGKIVKVDGSCSTEERTEAIDSFQNDPGTKIIVLQEQAGSLGVTLTAAHLCIFYSRSYSFLNREQAESRLHRIGQRNACTYIDLILKGSIEESICEALDEKRCVAGFLQGDFESLIVEKFKRNFKNK